ncbi:MAG: rhodanese-like domain-containing protein [Bacteroidales bacterium]
MKTFQRIIILSCCLLSIACHAQNKTFESLSNEEFKKILNENNIILVDVRTPNEYSSGHIPRAVNMDVRSSDFDSLVSKLDKKKYIAVYCRSGGRSKIAAKKITEKGYKVYELNTGVMNWKEPLTKPASNEK